MAVTLSAVNRRSTCIVAYSICSSMSVSYCAMSVSYWFLTENVSSFLILFSSYVSPFLFVSFLSFSCIPFFLFFFLSFFVLLPFNENFSVNSL